jgi:L-lactate dehydrogenase complex protein LldF
MSAPQPITLVPTLRRRTANAVTDPRLRAAVAGAVDTLSGRRDIAYGQLADVAGLRERARAVKAGVLQALPELLEQLADRLIARGVHVHWARTAEEANRTIVEIARRAGARRIVKSKSMATEEIELNAALEADGCLVTETDLGEWIIQVAHETPSHIIVPAIHRNRRQVAEALGRVVGGDLSDVPAELAAFARRQLRARFLEADLGISGVNFGVASAGALVLVTNEGNGRLVTSIPKVHVAVMGMERVVDTWAQLDLMLAMLTRAATGQPITTYVSVISGPRQGAEVDGPEEMHLVIVDNGRSAILGTEFTEMLACIRCGACLNVCPVYRQVGGHAYGWAYSGPMGAVLTPLLYKGAGADELPQASSLCGACWEACPVGIPLQDMLLALRRRNASAHTAGPEQMAWSAWAASWSRPATYRASLRAASLVGRMLGSPRRTPGGFDRWSQERNLPALPRRGFRELWKRGAI